MHGKDKCKVKVRVPSGEDIRYRVLLESASVLFNTVYFSELANS